jgi:tRNA nucleotidyltransferase/poly(A) polymerase
VTAPTLSEHLATLRDSPFANALARAASPARVWLVGGAVRDAALGRARSDYDAVVERDAVRTAERLAAALGARLVRLGGEPEGVLRIVLRSAEIDLWDLAGGRLRDDLARRDFTVNAIACDLASGEIVDPFGGLDDLARGRLRATRDSVFDEDPLRVVRLARFAATLPGFAVAPETASLSRARAPQLARIPGERIRQELHRLWPGRGFAAAQRALEESGAWPELWRPPGSGAATRDSAVVRAATLERVAAEVAAASPRPEAGLAAGHALCCRAASDAPGDTIEELARRRILSRRERHDVARLLAWLADAEPTADEPGLAWLLHGAGDFHAEALGLAAAFAGPEAAALWTRLAGPARSLLERRGDEILEPKPLLTGDEIAELLGIAPGPELGAAARRLTEAQVRGVVRSPAEARAALRSGARDGASGRSPSTAD